MTSDYVEAVERDGYAIITGCVDNTTVDGLLAELRDIGADEAVSRRAGRAFGIRNLLNVLPSARALADSPHLLALVEPILGTEARVVRGIYFDKHADANWKVAWHQDLTIAVRQQASIEGFGPWSTKASITHVQPPVSILENMLALRLHLDEADESNGALRVIPGTHKGGRLGAREIQMRKEAHKIITCCVAQGGVIVMRPLLLHSSSVASKPAHRRVLHFEYSAARLPAGLEWFDDNFGEH
jgi:ectoine hydroxylase-related dioxygenase (phytanoyl-CoA dioxygenase family)